MDSCIHMAESLHCSPETITTMLISSQFSSVAQSCPTLCDPMNRSMPGLPVLPQYKIKKFKVWGKKKFCPGKPAQPVSTGSVPRSVPSPEH